MQAISLTLISRVTLAGRGVNTTLSRARNRGIGSDSASGTVRAGMTRANVAAAGDVVARSLAGESHC
jgi:hypothetical protein